MQISSDYNNFNTIDPDPPSSNTVQASLPSYNDIIDESIPGTQSFYSNNPTGLVVDVRQDPSTIDIENTADISPYSNTIISIPQTNTQYSSNNGEALNTYTNVQLNNVEPSNAFDSSYNGIGRSTVKAYNYNENNPKGLIVDVRGDIPNENSVVYSSSNYLYNSYPQTDSFPLPNKQRPVSSISISGSTIDSHNEKSKSRPTIQYRPKIHNIDSEIGGSFEPSLHDALPISDSHGHYSQIFSNKQTSNTDPQQDYSYIENEDNKLQSFDPILIADNTVDSSIDENPKSLPETYIRAKMDNFDSEIKGKFESSFQDAVPHSISNAHNAQNFNDEQAVNTYPQQEYMNIRKEDNADYSTNVDLYDSSPLFPKHSVANNEKSTDSISHLDHSNVEIVVHSSSNEQNLDLGDDKEISNADAIIVLSPIPEKMSDTNNGIGTYQFNTIQLILFCVKQFAVAAVLYAYTQGL